MRSATPSTETARLRLRLRVSGLVQGVGFRPHVHRLATELHLVGFVGNDSQGVFMEVEGVTGATEAFVRRLETDAPDAARVDGVVSERMAARGGTGFAIVGSRASGTVRTFVSPDLATCDDCLRELFDPRDRRVRHPFINCTNCGPRFTITLRLPYDRPNTTMRGFALCGACAEEYGDPADRRFHAQPIACPDCGPRLWLERSSGADPVTGTDPAIMAAQAALARGEIVAIKGLGGFHLACDARSDAAVARLRERKHRVGKPFAVMARDLHVARTVAHIIPAEAALLTTARRPIVLASRRPGTSAGVVSALVAPGNPRIGLLLPYTPLHHLLFAPVPGGDPAVPVPSLLVMTSGNVSDEPICYDNDDARERLGALADAWLLHDRPIHVPCDDSVLEIDQDGGELPLRRSRGYAPLPVRLPVVAPPTLAVGGELKNTFCLAAGHDAFMSQHIGDMGSLESWRAFERSAHQLADLYGIRASQVAADAHPGYLTKRWAEEASGRPVVEIQHHHAHIASVMAEHGVPAGARVIGLAFDGTGFGTDGTIWGGEVLVAAYTDFVRVGHLATIALPGGDAAVRRPYRTALAHLRAAGLEWAQDLPPVGAAPPAERAVLQSQLEGVSGCVETSSMGRLFDAVSSLLGLCHEARYEAEAALRLQWAAAAALDRGLPVPSYRFETTDCEFDPSPVFHALAADLRSGADTGAMAAGFHGAVARVVRDVAVEQRERTGIGVVALSGGVFQNALLLGQARRCLEARRFRVLTHRVVPPNDGGLALGQAAIAGARAALAGAL
ncbi:MAG: carbamoyltransferase HypF [Acidimicrobiales bacterium]